MISAIDASGRNVRNVPLPSRVLKVHFETAYMTDQAISHAQKMGSGPWVLHLNYVKPHWPSMAPAPYLAMYKGDQCLPVVRRDKVRGNAHPVLTALRCQEECLRFQNDDCIRTVRLAY